MAVYGKLNDKISKKESILFSIKKKKKNCFASTILSQFHLSNPLYLTIFASL